MRPGSRKSIVWKYFKKSSNGKLVTCSLCKKQIKFFQNTTNLNQHLRRLHALQMEAGVEILQEEEIDVEASVPNSSTAETKQIKFFQNTTNLNQHLRRLHALQIQAGVEEIDVEESVPNSSTADNDLKLDCKQFFVVEDQLVEVPPQKRLRQETQLVQSYKDELDLALIELIAKHSQPLSIVEDKGFINYTKKLQPLYELPSKKHLTNILLPNFYNKHRTNLKNMLNFIDVLSVTIDIWLSEHNKTYMTITCHFIYHDNFYSYMIATKNITEANTSENIGNNLREILDEYNISDKIVTIVSDNRSNLKTAIDYNNKTRNPCFAHSLNLAVCEGLKSTDKLTTILNKCNSLVAHFKQNASATEHLQNTQRNMKTHILKVSQGVITKWNSCLLMIERLVQIKDALSVTLSNLKDAAPTDVDADEWTILQDCIPILKPFEAITTELSGEKYPLMSSVIPLIKGLQHILETKVTNTETGDQLKKNLLEIVNRRLGLFEQNEIAVKCTFLDPRFKKVAFGVECNANYAQNCIEEELAYLIWQKENTIAVKPIVKSELEDNIWSHFDNEAAKLRSVNANNVALIMQQYLEVPLWNRHDNPIEFWKNHKQQFPEMYILAVKYLSIPATSVLAERVFSKSAQIANGRKYRLNDKNLNQILLLNSVL